MSNSFNEATYLFTSRNHKGGLLVQTRSKLKNGRYKQLTVIKRYSNRLGGCTACSVGTLAERGFPTIFVLISPSSVIDTKERTGEYILLLGGN